MLAAPVVRIMTPTVGIHPTVRHHLGVRVHQHQELASAALARVPPRGDVGQLCGVSNDRLHLTLSRVLGGRYLARRIMSDNQRAVALLIDGAKHTDLSHALGLLVRRGVTLCPMTLERAFGRLCGKGELGERHFWFVLERGFFLVRSADDLERVGYRLAATLEERGDLDARYRIMHAMARNPRARIETLALMPAGFVQTRGLVFRSGASSVRSGGTAGGSALAFELDRTYGDPVRQLTLKCVPLPEATFGEHLAACSDYVRDLGPSLGAAAGRAAVLGLGGAGSVEELRGSRLDQLSSVEAKIFAALVVDATASSSVSEFIELSRLVISR